MALFAVGYLVLIGLVWQAGALRARWARRLAGTSALAAALAALPWRGVDFAMLKRADLLVALALVAVLLAHYHRLPAFESARRELRALALLAITALLVFVNFFSFHGEHTWIHYHDVAHYYLGAKYFPELGYGRLYTAMLRAEAESYDNHFLTLEARDLRSGQVVDIRALLRRSDAVKERFTPERWAAFRSDVRLFRDALGPRYPAVLVDHGFNPTPVWVAIGGPLANAVPAGSKTGILLLTLLDPLLLGLLAWLAIRAFGERATWLAVAEFCLVFGATFGWTGGAFLRYLWFVAAGASLCLVRLRRPLAAGAALALATALRIFPVFFLWGIVAAGWAAWRADRRVPAAPARFLSGFAATGTLLLAATIPLGHPIQTWAAFATNLQVQMSTDPSNLLGLGALAHNLGLTSRPLVDALRGTAMLLAAWSTARLARSVRLEVAWLLGAVLIFVSVDLGAYYFVFLALVALASAESVFALTALFGVEAATYGLLLFLPKEDLAYPYRNLGLAWLAVAVLLHARKRTPEPA